MLLEKPQVRRWTQAEYHQAAELGWFIGQRVELINGEVIEMAPQKDAHAFALRLAASAMNRRCGAALTVLVQMPLNFGPRSEPEPDIAVVRGGLREVTSHPTTAELVIEISDTTLAYDRGIKAALYAQNGVGEYWIVNLVDRQVEVFRRAAGAQSIESFDSAMIVRSGTITPATLSFDPVEVAELLP